MTYVTIQPPFTLKFREMSKSELKKYFEWFRNILPQRLDGLTRVVRATPGFEEWEADFSPISLELLGAWFAAQVETRARTQGEIHEIENRSPFSIEVPGYDLTNRTFSIAMDVAMYLSQIFLRSHPALRWDQPFGSKKFIDYGQPVLIGFGAAPFNPVRMLVTLAYGIASKRENGKGLRELYDIWARMVK